MIRVQSRRSRSSGRRASSTERGPAPRAYGRASVSASNSLTIKPHLFRDTNHSTMAFGRNSSARRRRSAGKNLPNKGSRLGEGGSVTRRCHYHYYHYCHSSPTTGRFLIEDPIDRTSGQTNSYVYLDDNPLPIATIRLSCVRQPYCLSPIHCPRLIAVLLVILHALSDPGINSHDE